MRKMSRTTKKNTSVACKKKSTFLNDLSIVDAENFEPPQLSSTPSKNNIRKSKRILQDNNSFNISIINKQDQIKKKNGKIDTHQFKPIEPVVEDNFKYDRAPELFYSDPEEESTESENITLANDSDDKWTTFSDVSEEKNHTNISDLLAEIEADVEVRFEKPPRRSYPGRKRNNKSLFEDEDKEEKEEIDAKTTKKDRKPKQKKIDPQEEAFIQSINEHFNDVETFSLAVE